MKKLKKNFAGNRLTIEAMAELASCSCDCNYGFCECGSIYSYAGMYGNAEIGYHADPALHHNEVIFG